MPSCLWMFVFLPSIPQEGRRCLWSENTVKDFSSALSDWDVSHRTLILMQLHKCKDLRREFTAMGRACGPSLSLLNLVLWISVCRFMRVRVSLWKTWECSGVACLQALLLAVNVSTGLCLLALMCSSILHVCLHQSSLPDTPVDQYCTCQSNSPPPPPPPQPPLYTHTHW